MPLAALDGVTLEYEVSGRGEPVVCVHGAFLADAFRPLRAEHALADRYRLITYSRRGYGSSGAAEPAATLAEQAADCRRLLSHLCVPRAHVVGHSLGGAIALQLSLDAPELVHTLALLEAGLLIGESAGLYRAGLQESRRRYEEVGAELAVDEFFAARWPTYRDELEEVLPGASEQAARDAATCFEADFAGGLAFRFGPEEARRIIQPALLVLGEGSVALHPRFSETQRLLLAWLPRAESFVLPGASHFLQLENPSGMAEALAGFFARHPLA
ncbi:MAG TPA: alpha/beta hydrolase [Gaiellaceae bacterium]|nr:alpha/beta hydrolase [Gaiellaceae bacterium]